MNCRPVAFQRIRNHDRYGLGFLRLLRWIVLGHAGEEFHQSQPVSKSVRLTPEDVLHPTVPPARFPLSLLITFPFSASRTRFVLP